MTSAPRDSANFCYRHPDRQSFVLCQRCGRTICPQCQTQAAVGVHCPECVKEARASAPRRRPAALTAFRPTSTQPVVTWSIIAVTVLVFILQNLPGSPISALGVYRPQLTLLAPWTMITALFLHASILHILFNMYSLFVFGPIIERLIGRVRFLALYLISGFGGSVAVLLLSPDGGVLGASGAIFGLMGAFFVIQRRLGGNNLQILIVIGINLAAGFFLSGISWQAHVGGLVAGAAVAAVYLRTRRREDRRAQVLLVVGIVVALIAITVARALLL
ncbi:MAG: Membrane associated serine protease, rhomboid family [Rhodoglobus sp.]|nr:Membrane associated serine protease, rhomboid family [Rhodoglobus sp.]